MYSSRHTITRAILWTLAESEKLMIKSVLDHYAAGTATPHIQTDSGRQRRPIFHSKRSFSSILNRLKRDGLVVCSGPKKTTEWSITKRGMSILKKTRPHHEYRLPPLPAADGIPRLVTFDVPEQEKPARNWLRGQLLASDVPSIRNVADERFVSFFEPDNPESLAKTIQRVLMDSSTPVVKAATAQKEAEKYTWEKRRDAILSFIDRRLAA